MADDHLIDRWTVSRLGRPMSEISAEDVMLGIPRMNYLRYDDLTNSELGGRLAGHLDHPEDEYALRLLDQSARLLGEPEADPSAEDASERSA